jgi:hypothetical protein
VTERVAGTAVKSALQRARARLDQAAPEREQLSEPTEPHARALLDQYIAGFEHADVAALERALRTDAAIEMVGTRTWFSSRVTCLRYLTHVIGSPGDWRMIPTLANGQSAAAAYRRDSDGLHRAFGLGVLTVTVGALPASSSSAAAPTGSPSSASHPSTRARKLRPLPKADEPTKVTRWLRCPWCARPVMAALYNLVIGMLSQARLVNLAAAPRHCSRDLRQPHVTLSIRLG